MHKLEPGQSAGVAEHPLPGAEEDGKSQQPVLVDLVSPAQLLKQPTATEEQDLTVSARSKAIHLGEEVWPEPDRVVPGRIGQGPDTRYFGIRFMAAIAGSVASTCSQSATKSS